MENILVIQTAFPGDAILTLPMIQFLYNTHHNCKIDVIAIPATKNIFESSPCVNSVYVLDKRNEHNSISSVKKFAKALQQNNYTRLYTPHRSLRTALLVYFLGINNSTGFNKSAFPFVFKNVIKYDGEAHEVFRNLKLAGFSGEDWKQLPMMYANDEEKIKVKSLLKSKNERRICVAPGSVWETKKYPLEKFEELCVTLVNKGFEIVLVGGKNDYNECEKIRNNNPSGMVNTCGEFSFSGSVELLRHADLLICNDSAPTHMAMAADIPVITVYCSTVPSFGFYPYNNKSLSVSYDNLSCKPCGIHGYKKCPEKHFNCGGLLNPELIINKAIEILS